MLRRAACVARGRAVAPARRLCTAAEELSVSLYNSLADTTLQGIETVVEEFADAAPTQEIDVEFSGDVLNVAVGARGTFVLNKQGPNKQIWLSSPISGPLRYDFSQEAAEWQHARDGRGLFLMLADDLEALTGKRLDFGGVGDELRDICDAGR